MSELFEGDELAYDVWRSKYALKDNEGNLIEKTPDEMCKRLAKEFARIESNYKIDTKKINLLSTYGKERFSSHKDWYKYYYSLFQDFSIILGGSGLEGVGSGKLQSLSNCFHNGVIEDNIDSIIDTAKSLAQVGKRRGGTSTDLSKLRPRGSYINNSAKESSGAVSWLELYDIIGKLIGQNNRKMAMMITMDINHPDIEEFITIKQDLSKVTNANLSIKLNKEFLDAVKNDEDYILSYPCNISLGNPYDFTKEYNVLYSIPTITGEIEYIKKIKAKELWDKITYCAWNTAEPGLLFWDNIINYDPTSVYEELKATGTNPYMNVA